MNSLERNRGASSRREDTAKLQSWRRIKMARAALGLLFFCAASSQPVTAQASPDLQEKLAAIKKSAAENREKLKKYHWTETMQLTLKGDPKPPKQFLCQYGPDGKVQKTPIGAQEQQQASGGRLKRRIVEKKTEEMKDYLGDVKTLLAQYLPPDPEKMQQAAQAGKISQGGAPGSGVAEVIFKDYAKPGDQMTLAFSTAVKKISTVSVNTYMDTPDEAVILTVQFASLPDGMNYSQQSVLNLASKNVKVTTTNSDYQPN
jgi:hypothetical protein